MSEQNQQPEVTAEEQQEAVLQIQRIYVKDVSFEAPNLPHIFHQEWKPKLGFDLSTEAVRLMNYEEAVVIDLRPIDEFQRGHIIGSVNLLPTEIKNQNVGKIEHHKEKPLIIVDVNGVSSATSAELLTKQGFEKVYVLKDGLAAWAGANLPLVKKHK